jgi:metallo-beta-lactamase family protein
MIAAKKGCVRVRITFHGATRQVTGSAHLLEIGKHRVLLDCGLHDHDRVDPNSLNREFLFDPRTLDAVILSHAHNDHIGRLPRLVRQGFKGNIYATHATGDITGVMLRDSARIQKNEWAYAQATQHCLTDPLFELIDVEHVVDQIRRIDYKVPTEILPGLSMTYHDAGHILGSAMVELKFKEGERDRKFVFTGDLGRRNMGLLPDPTILTGMDVLISESTYGGKVLEPYDVLLKRLHAILARAHRKRGRVIIPAFSLGRTQRLIYCLQELFYRYRVKPMPIFVDSPLSTRLTDIHRDFPDAYTPEARRLMDRDEEYFGSRYVEVCQTPEDSRRLNYHSGPMIVIASSGMCDAGRVRHHLLHAVKEEENAVVIVSYQAEGTLGRKLVDGQRDIKILDRDVQVRCPVYVLDGFSGHADAEDLAWWYEQTGGGIETAFLVHGEPESMEAIAPTLQKFVKNPVIMPEYGSIHEV